MSAAAFSKSLATPKWIIRDGRQKSDSQVCLWLSGQAKKHLRQLKALWQARVANFHSL